MSDDTQLRTTAFHEAGHVLLYLDRSVEFSHVTIVPDPDGEYLGRVHPAASAKVWPWDSAAIEAAGAAAEILLSFLDEDPAALTGDDDDPNGVVQDLAAAVYLASPAHREFVEAKRVGEGCGQSIDATLDSVVRVLLRRWDQVERLARVLFAADDGTLTYAQVLGLLDGPLT